MRGKLIVIEGTDGSGKQTQTELLVSRLESEGIKVKTLAFPNYDTPTGKIVGGPYLGKKEICESFFTENATNVDPKVASLYYAADRRYNCPQIMEWLAAGYWVILDRYTTSNMGHQGGKIKTKAERKKMFEWLHQLEHDLLALPIPDITLLLYMPYEQAAELKRYRSHNKLLDHHEASEEHLRNAERAYKELAALYNWPIINCVKDNNIKTITDTHQELYNVIKRHLNL
ncbi:MAG: dTMP kinase [Bacilli bacterium]|jgi:dTMP kinase